MGKEKYIWLDLLRILASIAVVMIHISAWGIQRVNIVSNEWNQYLLYNGIARFAVPVFVMISGAIYLNENKEISFKNLFSKYITRIAIIYIIWSIIYSVADIFLFQAKEVLFENNILFSIVHYTILKPKYHLWYLPMLITLLLVTPICKKIVSGGDKGICEYIIVLFLLFKVIGPTVLMFDFENSIYVKQLLNLINPVMICNWVGFYILGYYLSSNKFRPKINRFIYFLGVVSIVLGIYFSWLFSGLNNIRTIGFYCDFSIFSTIWAIAIFIFIKNCVITSRKSRYIAIISRYTLGIYLIHPLIQEIMHMFGINSLVGKPLILVPIITLLVYVFSFVVSIIISKIPILGRYII